jgi:hypothetical protein
MKVITFSTKFPQSHPRKGEPTHFVEKIFAGLAELNSDTAEFKIPKTFMEYDFHVYYNAIPKYHTIRAGNRWKVGDSFSPRIWSGKPYASKQIEFAPPIQIKKILDFKMDLNGVYAVGGKYLDLDKYNILARNDGLTETDLFHWFMPNFDKPKEFTGQILIWDENIEY